MKTITVKSNSDDILIVTPLDYGFDLIFNTREFSARGKYIFSAVESDYARFRRTKFEFVTNYGKWFEELFNGNYDYVAGGLEFDSKGRRNIKFYPKRKELADRARKIIGYSDNIWDRYNITFI